MAEPKYQLKNVFTFSSDTHRFEILWTQIGGTLKPPLVFIHGTPWSSVVWHDLASVLKDRYCIYLYDHPGFEKSPQPHRLDGEEPELDPGLTLRAEASAALFRHWKLQSPPHVVAHDNAGLVSLRLVLEHNIKFASLCLIDVVAIGPFGLPFFDLLANNHAVFKQIPPHFLEGFTRAYIKSAAYKTLSDRTQNLLAQQWLEGGAQGPARFLQEMLQAHSRTVGDLETRYGQVGSEIPVKIIWGAEDAWIPADTAHRLATALNAREVVLVEEAGHLIHYDAPSKLAFEVGLWLSQQQ